MRAVQPATLEQVAALRAALDRHYRDAPFAERVILRAASPDGERTSTVMVRFRPRSAGGAPGAGSSALLRLDLGNLIIHADDTHLIAAHAANPSTCYERALPDGLNSAVLAELLPPIPLPQIGWALGGSGGGGGNDSVNLFSLGNASIAAITSTPVTPLTTVEFAQPAPLASLSLRHAGDSFALDSMLANAGDAARTRIELTASDIDAGDPASWAIDTTQRSRVAAITDLKPLPGETAVGDPCPALGLITPDIEGWSFTDAVKRLSDLNPQPSGPVWIVLLVRSPALADGKIISDARLRLDHLATEFDVQRMQGGRGAPRIEARDVVVLELGEVNRGRIDAISKTPASGPTFTPLFSTTGMATFHRIAPRAMSAVIVLDQSQRLAGVVRLDGRMVDGETIREEVRRIISTPLPDPPSPAPNNSGGG